MSKLVAIFSAGGSRGAAAVSEVLARGHRVRAIARTEDRVLARFGDQVELVTANMEDPATLGPALEGVDSVVLIIPVAGRTAAPVDITRWVLNAARQAGVGELIFLLGGFAGPRYLSVSATASMSVQADLALNSGIPAVVLSPTVYLENIRLPGYMPGLHDQGYISYPPLSPGRRFSFTTHRDQARLAAAALDRPDLQGELIQIATPDPVTGEEFAALLTPWFGRTIRYRHLTPEEYGREAAKAIRSPSAAESMARMWSEIDRLPPEATAIETAPLEARIGVRLSPIAEHLREWPRPEPV